MIIIAQTACGIKRLLDGIDLLPINQSAYFDNIKSEALNCLGYFSVQNKISSRSRSPQNLDFTNITSDFRERAIKKVMLDQALSKLSDEEHYLITQLFYLQRTERELAEELNQTQQNINKFKRKILCKLYEILKK